MRQVSDDSWKPEGWETWSPTRRTLWRREKQIENAERLVADDPERAASVDKILDHLRREAVELKARLLEAPDA